ncbi:MAG: hypothetical protein ACFB8W_18710 [Elainellaceae cyanobacterium]
MDNRKYLQRLVASDPNLGRIGSLVAATSQIDRNHLQRRKQQRGINDSMIRVALGYGRRFYARGAWHFILGDRTLQGTPYARFMDELRGLTVVCQTNLPNPEILTTYWKWDMKRRVRR